MGYKIEDIAIVFHNWQMFDYWISSRKINNPELLIILFQKMESPPTKGVNLVANDDETTSRTSSLIQRIQRKRDENSNPRRSLSRKSLQSKQQSLELSKFYTKMATKEPELDTPTHTNTHAHTPTPTHTPTRQNIITRSSLKGQKEPKKRSPTPMLGKGRKKARESSEMERELQIAELARKLEDERVGKVAAEARAEAFEKELRHKLRKIKELEQELRTLKPSKQTNPQFTIDQKQVSQSGVNRLKTNFLQIRLEQLQKANQSLNQSLNSTKSQLQRLRIQSETIKQQNELFKHQIFLLSQQTESALLQSKQREIGLLKEKLRLSTSERQIFLDNLLSHSEQEKLRLQDRISCLELRVAFINRKQNEEIRSVVSKKDRDIAAVRKKLAVIVSESLKYRQQMESHRLRQSVLAKCHTQSLRSDSCSFSLSPEHDHF